MNENELYAVKDFKFDNPLNHKIDSVNDNYYSVCHSNYFHTFNYRCICYIKSTNFGNNDLINLTVSDKNMGLYELIKKLKKAPQSGFKFNQILKLTKKF